MVNKKIILPLIAALALIMAVAGVFAMNAKKEMSKKTDTTWYYNSTSTSESSFKSALNWSQSNDDEDCISNGARPCQLIVPASNSTELQSYLDSLNASSTSVLSVCIGKKE